MCIQIPCFNEEKTLPITLQNIPTHIEGVTDLKVVVIDDGSSDGTVHVAKNFPHVSVFSMKRHRGLAKTFSWGIQQCLNMNADLIVNLDADNQYKTSCISKLIAPIIEGRADIVLGARNFSKQSKIPPIKKLFQISGSRIVSKLCRISIPDAATGFRAFSREAAKRIHVFTRYTYTMETLVQAAYYGMRIHSVPIETNDPLRPSRLIRHPIIYVVRNAGALVRLIILYNSLRVFSWIALSTFFSAFILGWILSVQLGFWIFAFSMLIFLTGIVLDQISVNRRLLETIIFHSKGSEGDREIPVP